MPRSSDERRSTCPINHAVEILGDKWTLLVVRDIVFSQKRTFTELKAMPEGIATNILTDRLARLQDAEVLIRVADPEDGRRAHYELTEHGRQLVPILLDLMVWSRRHTKDVNVSLSLVRQIEQDREAAVTEVLRRLDEKP